MVTKMNSSFNKLSKFEKLDKLGEGTYGVVYKARGFFFVCMLFICELKKIRQTTNYTHSKKFVLPLKKKVFLARLLGKFHC